MKKLLVPFLLLLAPALTTAQIEVQGKERIYEVPLKYVTFLLLNDEKCPLQLNNPRVLKYKSGNLGYYYSITNNSQKPVKSFEIKEFDAFGNPSHEYTPNSRVTDEYSFLPYESFSTLTDENKLEIKDLDAKRAADFGLSERRKRIWIVIVTKVELFDGTTYDATSKYSSIAKFIEQIQNEEDEANDGAPKLTAEEKEIKLRDFIAEKM